MRGTVLKVENLNKSYGNTQVLSDIDLEIKDGDFAVVMGTSGSGKSTLLYCLSGMDCSTGGDISLCGESIGDMSEKQLEELRGSGIGFIFQDSNLVSNLSIRENILISGFQCIERKDKTEKQIEEETDLLIKQMGLSEVAAHLPSEASGGELQRCAIARTVIKKPKILFADEPTGALNLANSNEVLKILDELNKEGQTILMVTHSKEAALCGNRVIYLEDGNIKSELMIADTDRDEREKKLDDWLKELRW